MSIPLARLAHTPLPSDATATWTRPMLSRSRICPTTSPTLSRPLPPSRRTSPTAKVAPSSLRKRRASPPRASADPALASALTFLCSQSLRRAGRCTSGGARGPRRVDEQDRQPQRRARLDRSRARQLRGAGDCLPIGQALAPAATCLCAAAARVDVEGAGGSGHVAKRQD